VIGCATFEGGRAVASDQMTLFVLLKTCILTRHWIREGPFRRYCSLTALAVVDHYCGSGSGVMRPDCKWGSDRNSVSAITPLVVIYAPLIGPMRLVLPGVINFMHYAPLIHSYHREWPTIMLHNTKSCQAATTTEWSPLPDPMSHRRLITDHRSGLLRTYQG
jgi:hypothetical protein